MKKIFLLFFFCLSACTNLFPQKRSVGYLNAGAALFVPWNYHSDAVFFPAFTLTPGIKFFQDKDFAVVLNFPLSAGLTYKSDAFAGIDLPAMLILNIGSAAGNNANARFGFIIGAGAAYTNVVNHYDDLQSKKIHTEFWGYRFNLGVSFKYDRDIVPSIICTYGKSITPNNGSIVGIGLQLIMINL